MKILDTLLASISSLLVVVQTNAADTLNQVMQSPTASLLQQAFTNAVLAITSGIATVIAKDVAARLWKWFCRVVSVQYDAYKDRRSKSRAINQLTRAHKRKRYH